MRTREMKKLYEMSVEKWEGLIEEYKYAKENYGYRPDNPRSGKCGFCILFSEDTDRKDSCVCYLQSIRACNDRDDSTLYWKIEKAYIEREWSTCLRLSRLMLKKIKSCEKMFNYECYKQFMKKNKHRIVEDN